MRKNYLFKSLSLAATVVLAATSCSDDESGASVSTPSEAKASSYVVAVTSSDGADYLLYTDELGSEDLSVLGSGVETDLTGAQWYFHKENRVFGMMYNDGDAVPAESYVMGEARPVFGMQYTSARFTTYGTWGDYVVTSSANSYDAVATNVYEPYYNTMVYPRYMTIGKYHYSNGIFTSFDFESDNYLGTGEYCSMAGFTESNGWLYATVYPMGVTAYGSTLYADDLEKTSLSYYGDSKEYLSYVSTAYGGTNSGSFKPGEIPSTPFADQFHIAVFKTDSDFPNNPIILTDDRMSPTCGRKSSAQYDCISADDSGDVYLFSPGNERKYITAAGSQLRSTSSATDTAMEYVDHPGSADGLYYYPEGSHSSKVMRIKKGNTAFDDSYGSNGVFDVEAAMGGRSFLTCHFITGSGSKFLVQAYDNPGVVYATDTTGAGQSTNSYTYYVVDAAANSAKAVTGLDASTISAVTRNPFFEDGMAYIGVTSSANSSPAVYEINSETAVATKIMDVECSGISSIGKLSRY
ncbi:MAG: DUF4374 domain-containing protein [Rikenellaceae bacterium]